MRAEQQVGRHQHAEQAEVVQAEATREFRKKRWERFKTLAARTVVDPGVVDEEERYYRAAWAAWRSAQVAVDKARSDWKDTKATLQAAYADINLKRSLVQVALDDLQRARDLAELTLVRAPFDGVVIERTVDPGSFVPNATTGTTEPLLTVARTDILTVTPGDL